jgi:hypothetical protein
VTRALREPLSLRAETLIIAHARTWDLKTVKEQPDLGAFISISNGARFFTTFLMWMDEISWCLFCGTWQGRLKPLFIRNDYLMESIGNSFSCSTLFTLVGTLHSRSAKN